MLTTFRVYDKNDSPVYEGSTPLSLHQDRKGLHVKAEVIFNAEINVTIARMEVEIGNRTYSYGTEPVQLFVGDSFSWSVDAHLTDTAR
jgi:hypothetical protein